MSMKATGITAEYNPLHNGHVYHMDKARTLTGADAVVVAMSGDFVQRGEPAMLDKWKRTELALRGGADLVIEIPALYCLGNAGQYASAGVKLLEALGCDSVAFGSECGDTGLLAEIAGFLVISADEISSEVQELRTSGLSYPAARSKAYEKVRRQYMQDKCENAGTDAGADAGAVEEILQKELKVLESSNDILSLEYILAMEKAAPVAIKREGAGYSDPYDIRFDYQSATALRTQLFSGHDISKYVPECTAEMLTSGAHLTGPDRDKWFDLLRYAVMSTPAEIIEDCPSGGEGLSNLMKSEIMRAESWTQFARLVKSRRYTFTRIMRLCSQVLLGITRQGFDTSGGPEYVRVLGFTSRGRELLSEVRKNESATLPVITNISKEKQLLGEQGLKQLEMDIHASDLYNLATGADISTESDYRKIPVMI